MQIDLIFGDLFLYKSQSEKKKHTRLGRSKEIIEDSKREGHKVVEDGQSNMTQR